MWSEPAAWASVGSHGIRVCISTRSLSDSLCRCSELQSMITTMFVRLWLVSLAWYFDFCLHHFAQSLAVLCSPIILNPGCTSGKLQNDRLVLHPVWSSGTSPASAKWTPAIRPLSQPSSCGSGKWNLLADYLVWLDCSGSVLRVTGE